MLESFDFLQHYAVLRPEKDSFSRFSLWVGRAVHHFGARMPHMRGRFALACGRWAPVGSSRGGGAALEPRLLRRALCWRS